MLYYSLNDAPQLRRAHPPTRAVSLHLYYPRITHHSSPLSFHTLTNCPSRNSFLLILMQIARGCRGSALSLSAPISNVQYLTSAFSPSSALFCTYLHFFALYKKSSPFLSCKSALFRKNTGEWGVHSISLQASNLESLTPVFATHTDIASVSPLFATHTKTTGVWPNSSHFGPPFRAVSLHLYFLTSLRHLFSLCRVISHDPAHL
jgi:hypothetical protein